MKKKSNKLSTYRIVYWVEEDRVCTLKAKSKAEAIEKWEDGDHNFLTDEIDKNADCGIIDVEKV